MVTPLRCSNTAISGHMSKQAAWEDAATVWGTGICAERLGYWTQLRPVAGVFDLESRCSQS